MFHDWKHFAGKELYDYEPGQPLRDPSRYIPCVTSDWEHEELQFGDLFPPLVADPNADQLTGLGLGGYCYHFKTSEGIEYLVGVATQLARLRAMILGATDEFPISYLAQTDISPLWQAYPKLEILHLRGGNQLSLGELKHDYLQTLIIECSGLPVSVLKELARSHLPALTRLELFLGSAEYGWNGTVDDVRPLLSGELFPRLEYLGLCNSEIADDVAIAVAESPLLERIKVLDLSLGTLGDAGVKALLRNPAIEQLEQLNLDHSWLSGGVQKQLAKLPIEVDLEGCYDFQARGDRYVAVGE